MSEVFVIGDIHGGLIALKQVLKKLPVVSGDRFIFLGDYVDGWSQSYELIEYLIKLRQKYSCIFIKGNHDQWILNWLKGEEPDLQWLQHGGQSTIDSYSPMNFVKRSRHLSFFDSLLDFYIDSNERLFIHGGFASKRGPLFENPFNTLLWDRTLWELAIAVENNTTKLNLTNPERLSLFKEIFIGHSPTIILGKSVPMKACNVWNMDTGAAFNGKLTAMNINTKEFWQSSDLKELYPNEKGRNG